MEQKLPGMYGFGITVDNVNEALPLGLQLIKDRGVERVSRGIPFIEVPGPVHTIYRNPQRRVLFDEVRDANPFFHLMESMWILSGSKRVELPQYFLSNITRFSDDGLTFHGAYGYRLRHAFGYDQLACVVRLMKEKPDTRQAVLSIWHPELDLGCPTKDMPCNDMVMLSIRDDYLHMTVCNRSNDAIWGAYGANAVQFSILQEWLAAAIGVNVGYYVQQSNSYHVYPDNPFWQQYLKGNHDAGHVANPYMDPDMDVTPIALGPQEAGMVMSDCEELDRRATDGTALAAPGYHSMFFRRVVTPMITVYDLYKTKDYWRAQELCRYIDAPDWRAACYQWLDRRREKAAAKAADSEGGEL
jgi:hypothetical protein